MTSPSPLAILLERRLSTERLGPYRAAAGGDLERALQLYQWNATVGSAFLETLGHLEVVLRNALHEQLAGWHAAQQLPGEWYDDPAGALDRHRRDDIAAARVRIRREGKAETPGKVVAELMFGFWRFLLDKRYQPTLWAQTLRHAFPYLLPQRRVEVSTRCTPLSVSATGSRTTSRSTTCRYEPDTRTCCALPATSTPQSRRGSLESPGCRHCWEASPEGVPTHSSKKNQLQQQLTCRGADGLLRRRTVRRESVHSPVW